MSVQRDAARRFLVQAGLPLCHLPSLTALIVEAERRGEARGADFAVGIVRRHAPEAAATIAKGMLEAENAALLAQMGGR